jgi:hypothetical protein
MIKLRFLACSIFGVLLASGSAMADGQLGDFHGPWHDVPVASCQPHCKILGGGVLEGEDYNFEDDIPNGVMLDASPNKGHTECSGRNGCVFDPTNVSVDNVNRKIYTHVRSHSEAVRIRAIVPVLSIKQ